LSRYCNFFFSGGETNRTTPNERKDRRGSGKTSNSWGGYLSLKKKKWGTPTGGDEKGVGFCEKKKEMDLERKHQGWGEHRQTLQRKGSTQQELKKEIAERGNGNGQVKKKNEPKGENCFHQ